MTYRIIGGHPAKNLIGLKTPFNNFRRDEEGSIGFETWDWTVILEVWVKGAKTTEDILKEIHEAMYVDWDRGGYAITSYRTGVDFFYIDPTEEIKGMNITYNIRYEHAQGTM